MSDPHVSPPARVDARLVSEFRERFGRAPVVLAAAPGRVNLIGEHTDYNDGFVLPAALGMTATVALAPRPDRTVAVAALDRNEQASVDLDALEPPRSSLHWSAYVRGVIWALRRRGLPSGGFDAAIASTVPIGAGLASSAALELALARGLFELWGWRWEPLAAARACQQAEAEYVGVECGLMDQLCAALGRAGHALFIDCRSSTVEPVALPESLALVVLDTGTRRRLGESEFNARRRACERAARRLGVPALRDIDDLGAALAELPSELRPIVRHVVEENRRTVRAVAALRQGALGELGVLLRAGHRSLRDDYRVSSPALDRMVELAGRHPACIGARSTGAGFGGCVIALVEHGAAEDFAHRTMAAHGSPGRAHVEQASGGARIVG